MGCATSGGSLTGEQSRCSVTVAQPPGIPLELRVDEELRAFLSQANWRHVATLETDTIRREDRARTVLGHVDRERIAFTKGAIREWVFEPLRGRVARVHRRGLSDVELRASERCSQRQLALGAIVLLDVISVTERPK